MSAHHAHVAIGELAPGQVAEALDAFCEAERLPHDVAWRLRVALDEIVANIVSHGAAGAKSGAIDVWFTRDGDTVEVRIADDGVPFDPLMRPAPQVTAPLEDRRPGGLGIVLVKALMDDVRYERTSRNILILRKRLDAGADAGDTGHP
jgi:anti-sigma regulatory factor (Ser/Thr protein kinase)